MRFTVNFSKWILSLNVYEFMKCEVYEVKIVTAKYAS